MSLLLVQKRNMLFLLVELAYEYFDKKAVDERLEEILTLEAEICQKLPHTAALH